MAIIIPTASSTYADAVRTEGAPLGRLYVLAQFRSTADLDWVHRLRAALVTEELKYPKFLEARPQLKRNKDLWKRIKSGIGQATVIAIDPVPVEEEVRQGLSAERGPDEELPEKLVIDQCATAIIARTPIAYLPQELFHAVPWGSQNRIATLADFAPEKIKQEVGGGLRHAMILAARAHAMFDLPSYSASTATTWDVFRSPLSRVLLAELLATERNFDTENPKSVAVLNRAAGEIAGVLGDALPVVGTIADAPLVKEVDSRAVDEIQAADIAAGWARDMLETGEPRSLGDSFERVWVNGRRIK